MLDRSAQTILDERHNDLVAEGARFDGRTIIDTIFVGCDFYWGSFFMTKFVRTNFEWCDLRGADFKQCTFEDCSFSDCNLMAGPIGGPASFDGTPLDGIRFLRCHGVPIRDSKTADRYQKRKR